MTTVESAEFSVFHGLVGLFVTLAAMLAHVSPAWCAGLVVVLGVAHELYDGDLPWRRPFSDASYEGWKDVLSFLPAPFLYALWGLR